MKKTISFGKIDYNNSGKKINEITVDIELKLKYNGITIDNEPVENYYVFSASASVWNHIHSDIIAGGQMFDKLMPYFKDNKLYLQIYRLWKRWHLNDLNPGNRKQMDALKDFNSFDYDEQCEFLKGKGLYKYDDYIYGHGWRVEIIPDDIIKEIKSIIED